jgi:hypothetical protein
LPKDKYYSGSKETYSGGQGDKLQLEKISHSHKSYNEARNDFFREVVTQRKLTFETEHHCCWHCYESDKKASFKLILQTKLRLIYTCSRCENTELFFDILEWE